MHDKHVLKSKACYRDETGEHNCKHVGGQVPGQEFFIQSREAQSGNLITFVARIIGPFMGISTAFTKTLAVMAVTKGSVT